jgi:tetratricopeptide (TPR) repeat protein
LRLLEFLLRSRRPGPFLVLATCRRTQANAADLKGLLAGLRRSAAVVEMTLGGLSDDETGALLGSALGSSLGEAEAAGALNLRRHTGGNPFFLQAVAQDLVETGCSLKAWSDAKAGPLPIPDQLRDVVRWRLRQVSSSCLEVLAASSAVGESFSGTLVREILGRDERFPLAALDEARLAGLVTAGEAPEDHRFAHAVVRRALYDDLGPTRRVALHHRVGDVLEARPALSEQPRLAELAHHFYLGAPLGGPGKALEYARLAADEALRQFAYETANDQLSRALEIAMAHLPDDISLRSELLLAVGDARHKAGLLKGANEAFLEAFDKACSCGRSDLVAQAALGYGGILPAGVEPDERAREMLSSALEGIGARDSPERSLALARLAHWAHFDTSLTQRQQWATDAVAMARRLGDNWTLSAALAHAYWALDGPDGCSNRLAVSTEIQALGSELENPEVELRGLKCELHVRLEIGDFAGCTAVAGRMAALAAEIRQPEYLRLVCMWESLVAGLEGRYDEAEAKAQEALEILGRAGHPQAQAAQVAFVLPWRWLQGRMDELTALLEAGRTGRNSPAEVALGAWVASELGEDGLARDLLGSLSLDHVLVTERNFYWWLMAVGLARTAVNLEAVAEGETIYAALAPYASHNCRAGQATFLGAAALHLGALASLLGRYDDAVAHYEAALERHRTMGARPFEALTMTELAAALERRARPGDCERARGFRAKAGEQGLALKAPWALTPTR